MYDDQLASRLRTLLADEPAITEKRMFGGLAFLVHGKMCVAASHDGGLLVRIDPGDAQALLRRRHAAPMEMNGRKMNGWIRVRPEGLGTKRDLRSWVEHGLAFAQTH